MAPNSPRYNLHGFSDTPAQQAIRRATGQLIGKHQLERFADDAAADFQRFYAQRQHPTTGDEDPRAQVIFCDGKRWADQMLRLGHSRAKNTVTAAAVKRPTAHS